MFSESSWLQLVADLWKNDLWKSVVVAALVTAWLNDSFLRKREREKWHKEKLFETYTKCISNASLAIQMSRTRHLFNQDPLSKKTETIVELLTSLNILRVLCSNSQADVLRTIEDETQRLLQSDLLNNRPEDIEVIKDKIIWLMQNDPKLKELGK